MLSLYVRKDDFGMPSMPGSSKSEFPAAMASVINGYDPGIGSLSITLKNGLAIANCGEYYGAWGLIPGMVVRIDGATPSGLNGDWKIQEVFVSTNQFTFATTVTGTVTGSITATVPGSAITVTNPSTDVYYYYLGGKYMKVVIMPGGAANFYMTDSLSDTNITTAIDTNIVSASNYIIFTDGNCVYFYGNAGVIICGKIDSLKTGDNENWIIGNGYGTWYLSRSYTQTGGFISATVRPFILYNSILRVFPGIETSDKGTVSKITVWENNNTLRGYLRGVYDVWGNIGATNRARFNLFGKMPNTLVYWYTSAAKLLTNVEVF